MANSDGSLKFDTQLDNSGFEKGADKIQRNLDSIKASAEQVNAASSRAGRGRTIPAHGLRCPGGCVCHAGHQ